MAYAKFLSVGATISVTTSGRMTSTSLPPSNAFHQQNLNTIQNLSGKEV